MATLPVAGEDGMWRVPAQDLTPHERSRLGSYMALVKKVLDYRDPYAVAEFEGEVIAGIELPTDPYVIERLAFQGEFDIDHFYDDGEGDRP